jgi:hypothetical protein
VIPAGIAATVPDKPTGISPDPQKNHHPAQSVKLHPACRPRACATTILGQPRHRTVIIGTRPRSRMMGQQGREQHHCIRAGGYCLHRAPRGNRPDAATRTKQAQTGPRSPCRRAAARRPLCRRHPDTAAAPSPPPGTRRRSTSPAARPNPDEAQMGPDLGRAAPPNARCCSSAPPPTAAPPSLRPPELAVLASEPDHRRRNAPPPPRGCPANPLLAHGERQGRRRRHRAGLPGGSRRRRRRREEGRGGLGARVSGASPVARGSDETSLDPRVA